MEGYEPVMSFDESNAVYGSLAVRGNEEAALHVSVWGR
jgi:hypothetical protein